MACHPVLFPPHISRGATGGPKFKTAILTGADGSEQRNIGWSRARGEWEIDRNNLHTDEANELIRFFRARYGCAYSWLFKDWADYKARMVDTDELPLLLTTGESLLETTQLVKRYESGGYAYLREINRPVQGTIVLYADNEPISASLYSIDYSTGLITWIDFTPSPGVEIRWDGEFFVPVRFGDDHQALQIERGPRFAWSRIAILKVRNEEDVEP